ncbi:autoinducer binding domain-containing protein [Sinorhizobium numidicum]|uniref:Autoinducer binding domain-containing protein n=1 Tax=Sinorhizobium numidicum TaxID=680248 RepID=A0ABY8D6S2_9HYPH|nr:autoinducer binding domain-containing protein [Sinorhizobium numidicum]WEX78177.1 autoinducer binding domain-containing protein [Sinorhizobium numidicum]WEX84836.1 autoinducer binding domain-containing protein [Sinorhizobium numidicum]
MIDFTADMSSLVLPDGRSIRGPLGSEDDIKRVLNQVSEAYGFRGFMVLAIPDTGCHSLAAQALLTTWASEFLRRYDSAGLIDGSPVIQRLRRSTIPFTYDAHQLARRRLDGKGEAAISVFEHANMPRGVYLPVHDAAGHRAAIAFGGDRPVVSNDELQALNLLAGLVYSRLTEVRPRDRRGPGSLSRREIECLRWAAAGKTTIEMARIMALSEYTVNHYLNRATRKLDSVNRVQTVAKAMRAGLIN